MPGRRSSTRPNCPRRAGFSHAVRAGDTVYLAGQIGEGATLAEQFDGAAAALITALRAAGGTPEDLVSLQIFVTDVDAYRTSQRELGGCGARASGATTRRWVCSA